MRIEDETFRFEGDSTLLSLQNGGGKSVLVQMMVAPFVRKRYRDTPDREFASFFTTNRPTFILTEWVLDGGAGYVLVGMMVRQKQASQDEEAKDELDMINFIHEYKEPNDYDIHNLPVIELTGKQKKLKGFNACKLVLEEAKRKLGIVFQYYDMNQSAQQKKYFERLKEFQINHTEWETIIKKVNLKESGLSELFKDAKDEAGLVEKWFLSAVESKLNKDENRIREFAKIIYKFILQYKENQTKIERKDTILAFKSDAQLINEEAGAFLEAQQIKEEYEEKIGFLRQSLLILTSDHNNERLILEERLEKLKDDLQAIYYEEASYQIYCLLDGLEIMNKELKATQQEKVRVQKVIDDLIYQIKAMECAVLYKEYKECSRDVLLLENQLEILREEEKDLLPERNQLGYNLRCYYEEALKKHKIYLREQEDLYLSRQEEVKKLSAKEEQVQKQLQENERKLGQVQTRISAFDKEEIEYNSRYNESLERNILRTYEEGSLDIFDMQMKEELEKLQSTIVLQKQKKEENDESIISCSRDIEDNNRRLGEVELKTRHKEEQLKEFEMQLESRRRILRFIGHREEDVFQIQMIEESFLKVIKELGNAKKVLERQREELEEEYTKLETGKILDLPKEFSELLVDMDLTYVYGMDWLKKNGNSFEVNQQLIKNNPMLPYSIIMTEKSLRQLSASSIDFYTSFPIPIIRREDLDNFYDKESSCIYGMDRISFFVMFNHHLLDEKALQELLNQKRHHIEKLDKLIIQKEDEIREYENKYNEIKYQTVTEEKYQACVKDIDDLKNEKAQLEELLRGLRSKKDSLQQLQKELTDKIDNAHRQEQILNNKIEDFSKLYKAYEDYLMDLNAMAQIIKDTEKFKEELRDCKDNIIKINQFIQELAGNRERSNIRLDELRGKAKLYESYQEGELLNKDIEDIEARFDALTKKISDDQFQLEARLGRAKEYFESKQKQLLNKEVEYNLVESDYQDVVVDEFADKEAKRQRDAQNKIFNKLEKAYYDINTQIAVQESKINTAMEHLEDRFQKDELWPREQIIDLAFKKRAQLILAAISKEEEKLKICQEKISSYDNNLSSLAEFDHFTTEKSFTFDKELAEYADKSIPELTSKELMDFRGRLVRDYRSSLKVVDERKEQLRKCLEEILGKGIYVDEFFKRPIETMLGLPDQPQSVLEQLAIILGSYEALLEQMEVDIAIVEKEQQKVIEMLLDYIADIHKNLAKIDRNSSITVRGRSIKMLKIIIPEWEEYESVYKLRLQDFVDEITKRGLQRLDQNENIEEMIGAYITTKNLYDTVVGIGNINIKLYKIEAQREYPITWAEVSKNSGGEGFLSAFVVLSSLLSYMRREDTDLFFEKEEGKVLLMDNPFAQTNAAHLLKPLIEVAKKNNTQLICLSGLGGESIYNRFDNIYVLNLVSSGIQKNIQYVKGERIKGEDDILFIQPAQVKVEAMEQIELMF